LSLAGELTSQLLGAPARHRSPERLALRCRHCGGGDGGGGGGDRGGGLLGVMRSPQCVNFALYRRYGGSRFRLVLDVPLPLQPQLLRQFEHVGAQHARFLLLVVVPRGTPSLCGRQKLCSLLPRRRVILSLRLQRGQDLPVLCRLLLRRDSVFLARRL
jgi:hypothetical protein